MSEPSADPGMVKLVLDWLWAACIGAVLWIRQMTFKRLDDIDARMEMNRKETRDQLIHIFEKLENVTKLIYERTDGDKK